MRLSDFEVSYAGRDYRDEGGVTKRNLILLGASDYNLITRDAMKDIKSTLYFDDSIRGHQIAIHDRKTNGEPWDYYIESGSDTLIDYSLIIKAENPWCQGKQLLLVAGCSGFGTQAGVQFVTSIDFLEHPLVSSGAPCEFLIETKIRYGTLVGPKIRGEARLGETLSLS